MKACKEVEPPEAVTLWPDEHGRGVVQGRRQGRDGQQCAAGATVSPMGGTDRSGGMHAQAAVAFPSGRIIDEHRLWGGAAAESGVHQKLTVAAEQSLLTSGGCWWMRGLNGAKLGH